MSWEDENGQRHPTWRRIYLVSKTEKTTLFAMNEEERHQYMARANRQAYEREVAAQAEARATAEAEWEAKYGGLNREEVLKKMGAELIAEIEAPRDVFTIGYTALVTKDPEQAKRAHEFADALQEEVLGEPCPDTIELTLEYENGLKEATVLTGDGEKTLFDIQKMSFSAKVLLYPIGKGKSVGVAIRRRGRFWRLGTTGMLAPTIHRQITDRNRRFGWETPAELLPNNAKNDRDRPIEHVVEFSIHTSQEMDALYRAQCDGKTFTGYLINDQAGAIVHESTRSSHRVQLMLTEDERTAGLALTHLENLVRSQDADAVIATSYILGVLAPPPHLPMRPYAGGWIDFDDGIKKIGWYPQTTKERRQMHARFWEFVKFGERAHIVGKRIGAKYTNADGDEINTTIHGAAWRVMKTETPDQPSLYAALETPVRAEIVVSRELTALLTHPKTAQYLEGAQILGAIPSGQAAGAWARVIGVALLSFWRRNPREVDAGVLQPTRREMLDHFAAKVAPYKEILATTNPSRVIDYWCTALQILADGGFIERSGEAAITPKEMKANLPRKNWQNAWLDQTVNIEVGTKIKVAFAERVAALPKLKPRDLKKKRRATKRPKVS